jgi:hypothetical protein
MSSSEELNRNSSTHFDQTQKILFSVFSALALLENTTKVGSRLGCLRDVVSIPSLLAMVRADVSERNGTGSW